MSFCLLVVLAIAAVVQPWDAQAQITTDTLSLKWQKFEIPEFGTTIEYPAAIFAPSGASPKGTGQSFDSQDRRAALSIYSRANRDWETPATYLRSNLRIDRSTLDYQRVTRSFFAVSMEREGLIFYSRCNFSSRLGEAIHCFDLVYPQEEKRAWDAVVTRMSLSLRPREG
jgi:hypothetical protein